VKQGTKALPLSKSGIHVSQRLTPETREQFCKVTSLYSLSLQHNEQAYVALHGYVHENTSKIISYKHVIFSNPDLRATAQEDARGRSIQTAAKHCNSRLRPKATRCSNHAMPWNWHIHDCLSQFQIYAVYFSKIGKCRLVDF
jgi:hypothetical protein